MSKINDSILEASKKNAEIMSNAILGTPPLIVLWMISLIPEEYFVSDKTTFLDPACGRGTFLKCVYIKLRKCGHSHQNAIGRIFGIDKYSPANETSEIFPNIIKKDFLKMEFPENWPKSFDISLSNPPYSKYLHLKFLEKCLSITTEKILFVHPSNSFINTKGGNSTYVNSNLLINDKLETVTLFNGNKVFNIDLKTPCSITTVNPKGNRGVIEVSNLMTGDKYEASSISEITQFKNSDELWSIKSKIDSFVNNNGSLDDVLGKKKNGEFMVEFSRIRGNHNKNGEMEDPLVKNDFYTFLDKRATVESKEKSSYDLWFKFTTKEEGENFIKYLKSDFARFSLAMYKFAQSLNNGELRFVPLLDFREEWDDSKLFKKFNITKKEQEYIRKIIPAYYD